MSQSPALRIGELAEFAGVSTRTIRHYHRVGVLPEPVRRPNGYRAYGLADVAQLLRVRRLVELGLSLDEVADALAGDQRAELRDILAGLAADLAAQERRIAERREQIEALLARGGDLSRSDEQQAALADLVRVAGPEHPGIERERSIAELVEHAAGAHAWPVYQRVLADGDLSEAMLAVSRRFEDLAGKDPDDPVVDELAAETVGFGVAIGELIPAEVRDGPGDPAAAGRLLRTVTAEMDAAQARCLALMFEHWRSAS